MRINPSLFNAALVTLIFTVGFGLGGLLAGVVLLLILGESKTGAVTLLFACSGFVIGSARSFPLFLDFFNHNATARRVHGAASRTQPKPSRRTEAE